MVIYQPISLLRVKMTSVSAFINGTNINIFLYRSSYINISPLVSSNILYIIHV